MRTLLLFAASILAAPAQTPEPERAATLEELGRNAIREIQLSLSRYGYETGPVDGLAGPRTFSALRMFQACNGLEPDVRLGSMTRSLLDLRSGELFASGEASERENIAGTDAIPYRECVAAGVPVGRLTPQSVEEVQSALARAGLWTGPIDGVAGPNLENTLATFQRLVGVPPSGTLDPRTAELLGVAPRTLPVLESP